MVNQVEQVSIVPLKHKQCLGCRMVGPFDKKESLLFASVATIGEADRISSVSKVRYFNDMYNQKES